MLPRISGCTLLYTQAWRAINAFPTREESLAKQAAMLRSYDEPPFSGKEKQTLGLAPHQGTACTFADKVYLKVSAVSRPSFLPFRWGQGTSPAPGQDGSCHCWPTVLRGQAHPVYQEALYPFLWLVQPSSPQHTKGIGLLWAALLLCSTQDEVRQNLRDENHL